MGQGRPPEGQTWITPGRKYIQSSSQAGPSSERFEKLLRKVTATEEAHSLPPEVTGETMVLRSERSQLSAPN